MSAKLRMFLAILVLTMLSSSAWPADPMDLKARAALALAAPAKAKTLCDCAETGVCTCGDDCQCAACNTKQTTASGLRYDTTDWQWCEETRAFWRWDAKSNCWWRYIQPAQSPQFSSWYRPATTTFRASRGRGGC